MFSNDILSFVIDNAPQAPVLVLPQDTSIGVLDRIIDDPYAKKVLMQVESPVRSGYIEWIVRKFRDHRAQFDVVYME
jgi:hypothetical protein